MPIGEAGGACRLFLLNDWSARDIQAWEYQPLGPFLSKNFATTVSPWVVTPRRWNRSAFRRRGVRRRSKTAAVPVRQSRPAGRRLRHRAGGPAVTLGCDTGNGSPPSRPEQHETHVLDGLAIVTHHTCNGCNLRPGDLLGSGTLSGPDEQGFGSLLESTRGGSQPIQLQSGEERRFQVRNRPANREIKAALRSSSARVYRAQAHFSVGSSYGHAGTKTLSAG